MAFPPIHHSAKKNRAFEYWWAQTGGQGSKFLGRYLAPLGPCRVSPLRMSGPRFLKENFIFYSLSPYSLARSKLSGRSGPLSLSSKARNGPVCPSPARPNKGPRYDPFRPSRATTARTLRPLESCFGPRSPNSWVRLPRSNGPHNLLFLFLI